MCRIETSKFNVASSSKTEAYTGNVKISRDFNSIFFVRKFISRIS